MLAEIAYEGFSKDQLFFQKQQLVDRIKGFLADTVDNPKYLDGQKILNAIAAQQGILVERAEDIYSFSHLTLQEYLTAQYISQKDSRIEELVTKHLTEKRWREIFLLVAGLKDDAGGLLRLMEKATQQCINTPKLHNLLIWVEKVTDTTSGDFQLVGKRAITLANAYAYTNANANANAYALAYANANAYVNALAYDNACAVANANALANAYAYTNAYAYALAYANAYDNAYALDQFIDYAQNSQGFQIYQNVNFTAIISRLKQLKEQIPNDKAPIQVFKDFGKCIIQTWLEAFYLTPDTIDLSQSELDALDNYFYANLLMVQCKEAAVRVSKGTWQGIESRMLLPVNSNHT